MMMDNLIWLVGALTYGSIAMTYIIWKANQIANMTEETSSIEFRKETKIETPCYDCL